VIETNDINRDHCSKLTTNLQRCISMIQIIRPKPSEYGDTESDNENIDDTKPKETDSFDRTVAITRYGMRLLGFWPQDTQLLCHLQCGTIFTLIVFVFFPAVMQMYTMIYDVTDWNAVMHQSLDIILLIMLLSRFIFMKVMAKNFRLVLHAMTTDWADYRYLTKQSQWIMIYYARKGRRFSIFSIALLALTGTGEKSEYQVISIIKFSLDNLQFLSDIKFQICIKLHLLHKVRFGFLIFVKLRDEILLIILYAVYFKIRVCIFWFIFRLIPQIYYSAIGVKFAEQTVKLCRNNY